MLWAAMPREPQVLDRELRKSGDATHFATDGPAPRRYCMTSRTATAARVPRVRPSLSGVNTPTNALVGGGFLQPAPRSANLDSAFGGMQLLAPEAWRAAPLLLTRSAHRWHNPLCGCHSCDSDGLALTGPQSLVLRLV